MNTDKYRIARLAEICSIHSGYTARNRLEDGGTNGILTLQLRDIASDGTIDLDRLLRSELNGLPDRYLVGAGDVIFRSRGEYNTATALDDRFRAPVVAVLPLIIIRPNVNVVIPEYVAWTINQLGAQRYFDTFARGTSMRMIPKSCIDELQINLPALTTQRRIVAVDALAEREKQIALLIAEKRRRLNSLRLAQYTNLNLPKTI